MTSHDDQMKEQIFNRYLAGEKVISISEDVGIAKSTLYDWIRKAKAELAEQQQIYEKNEALDSREYYKLKNRVAKLESMLEILKTACGVEDMPLDEKLSILDKFYEMRKYSVHMMCEALDVPRGTFYNHMKRGKKGNTVAARRREEMRHKILEIFYDSNQIFGAPKITAVLKDRGEVVSRAFVAELMKEMGLTSIRSGAKKQYYDESRKCRNHVQRKFSTDRPNQIWVSDVTYYRFKEKQYFICAIIDLFSRRVVAYKVGYGNNTHLTKETFKMAYAARKPAPGLVFHSDQGSNYRARVFMS